jgi:putative membrane protein
MKIQGRSSSRQEGAEVHSDQRHVKRSLYVLVLAAVAALTVVGPVGTAEASSSAPRASVAASGGVTLQTEEPALTAADKDLVVKVRLAGLWEIPAGKMAMTKGVAPRVRQIGQMIASQHVRLDALDRAAAKEVAVALPDQPTSEQRRWLDEMTDAKGTAFDDIFVQRLRAAHGKIFPAIGVVRATTENDTVRKLAQSANAFVLTHLTLLESTGLVRYDELPTVVAPATGPIAAAARRSANGGIAVPVIWMILAVALISGAIFTARMVRPRNFGNGQKGRRRAGGDDPPTGSIAVQPADGFFPKQGLRLSNSPRSLP